MDKELEEIVQGFLSFLKKTKKTSLLPRIVERLKKELPAGKVAYAKMASLPTPAEEKEIEKYVEKVFGEKLKVQFEVDPSLLAGLRLEVDDRVFDQSLKGRLKDLKEKIAYGY